MKCLVLGGTLFLGRHVVEAALARGHEVAILNRGRTDPGPMPALARVERLVGDRDGDLSVLHGRAFDAVIDCTGYTAGQMRRVAGALGAGDAAPAAAGGAVAGPAHEASLPHYVFVSSISVCASFPPGRDFDEDAPLAVGDEGYGANKARAEEAIVAALPGRVAVVRPGLVVGPFDPTGRFSYWPLRVARGGRVLAPGPREREVQVIDARDLAAWCVHLAEHRTTGTFNAVGPRFSMGALLEACRAAAIEAAVAQADDAARQAARDLVFAWRTDAELLAADVAPWTGLPLWLPADDAAFGGMLRARNDRALAAGLAPRPIAETIRDTLAWARSPGAATPKQVATLAPAREAQIVEGG
jgi:2'-hydroxyisoflavone reductase